MSDVLMRLFHGLARHAPGSADTTRRMLRAAAPEAGGRALDIGCGTGASAVQLAAEGGLEVTAVDLHDPFLEEARRRAGEQGVDHMLRVERQDMTALPYSDESFHLLWAEGSAYVMGLADALAAWRRLLAPGGRLALTECSWTTRRPSPDTAEFWGAAYPAMRHADDNAALAREAGYEVLDSWVLPDGDWWADYYTPLARRLERVDPSEADDVAPVAAEIDLRRRRGAEYGYVAYILTV